MIKPILRYPDPVLTRKTEPVTHFGTDELGELTLDLWDTLRDSGGVGLAAPQIGVSLSVAVIHERVEGTALLLINPRIVQLAGRILRKEEGCLSLPGVYASGCPRFGSITVQYQDIHGTKHLISGRDFFAQVLQHEIDHLNGILYPTRLHDSYRYKVLAHYQQRLQERQTLDTSPGENLAVTEGS